MADDVRYTAGMFSSDISKSPFWVEWEKRYEARHRPGGIPVTAGHEFWLKDNMRYKVLSAKDFGAFASVWKGRSTSTGRLLALKRYQNSQIPSIKEQVLREVHILDTVRKCVSMSTSPWCLGNLLSKGLRLRLNITDTICSLTSYRLEPHGLRRRLRQDPPVW